MNETQQMIRKVLELKYGKYGKKLEDVDTGELVEVIYSIIDEINHLTYSNEREILQGQTKKEFIEAVLRG